MTNKQKLVALRNQRKYITECIDKLEREIAEDCRHTDTVIEQDYVSGSYYDRAQYIKRTRCVNCDKILNESIEYGSYG